MRFAHRSSRPACALRRYGPVMIVAFTLAGLTASTSAGPNLIVNGDFEGGTLPACSGVADGWEAPTGCDLSVQSISTDRHSGAYAQRLSSHSTWDHGRIQQVTNYNSIQEGKTYEISAWIKAQGIDNPAGWAVLRLEVYSNDSVLFHQNMPEQESVNYDWREIKWHETVPYGYGINRFAIVLSRHWGNGTVWYDDVSVREILPGDPVINLDPLGFDRSVNKGQNLPDDTFTVQNTGGGTLEYTITPNQTWLSVDPPSGSSTGDTDTITISYGVTGLNSGLYSAIITVSDPDAVPTSEQITVDVRVGYPGDFDNDTDVDQEDFGFFQACYTSLAAPPAPGCEAANLDGLPGIDQGDFAIFRSCLSGPDIEPDADCGS